MRMSLEDRGAGAHDFSPLAESRAGGTQRAQTPLRGRPILGVGQSTRARRLARAIDVKDEEVVPLSVPQSRLSAPLSRGDERADLGERG
jgi:hypothetical protein